MRVVSKVLVVLCLLWNVGALARQPTRFLPDPELTPGGVFEVTLEDICTPGHSKKVRAVTKALRDQVYRSYGIPSYQPGEYQLDHLVPLSIGGSNSIRNLWPQPNNTSPWDARAKDALERRLLKLVCAGQVDLETAQREIATDWTKAYQTYIGGSPPVAATPEPLLLPNASENEVWVNTRSGKYWKPGSQFFGKTKQGKFMTESDAINSGYRPARGTGN
jgi:hypothetical protein